MTARGSCCCWFVVLVAGCASLPGSEVASSGGRRVEVSSLPGPGPTVVFETGLAGSKETWDQVFAEIGKSHAVFAYNRPGVGRSTAAGTPRDGGVIVAELRALLVQRGARPPYVLVGHSAGGLYMQFYARRYPQEVAGLVLVDPTHPTQFEGEGALENRSQLSVAAIAVAGYFGPTKAEFDGLAETGRQVLAAPPLSETLPTRILIAPSKSSGEIAAWDNAKRNDFARLYPQAIVTSVDCGHNIQEERPGTVIEAIRDVISASQVPR